LVLLVALVAVVAAEMMAAIVVLVDPSCSSTLTAWGRHRHRDHHRRQLDVLPTSFAAVAVLRRPRDGRGWATVTANGEGKRRPAVEPV
jgi:hypothetical protein